MIKENVVKVPFRKLKYIHHISDIQIRNLKRHREYEEVFERTYTEIKKYKDNSVVYIGGDIAHSKTDMSPELVDQLSRLFKNLADIVPTIIIAGNHDCNLNNLNRLDCLTPIVKNLNHPNLHYLKNTGIYKCADVQFVVWDVWDKDKDYIKAKDVGGDTKIVLYHGTVDQSRTDLGFKLPSKVKLSLFNGYDLGLLGDIHKRQHLNKKETISYCGSLIQQNHGEGLDHGYLLWDVSKRKSTYIPILNDYGYYTIDIDDGKVPIIGNMPKKARVRVRVSNTTATQLKKALAVIHKEYGIREITVTKMGTTTERVRGEDRIDVGDITNASYQFGLIEDYLKRNHIIDDDVLLKIKNINDELNRYMPEEDISRNINWKIKKFEFSNMFSYGENNVIDLTRLTGMIGLFAPNASGKSALLDAISFCLFDTSSRAFKGENVLNNKKKSFQCKINFEINDLDYFIERFGRLQRDGHVKVDVNFWMIDESGDKISLNGDQRRTTNANIRRVIGTYDDFLLTTLSAQNNSTVFLDKTQKEKKELLAQFMGLSIFDRLYVTAHEEISEVYAVLRNFKKTNFESELSIIEKEIENQNKVKDSLESEKIDFTSINRKMEKEILKLNKQLKLVEGSITDIDKLKENSILFKDDLNNIDEVYENLKTNFEENKRKESKFEELINEYNTKNVNQKYLELEQYEYQHNLVKIDIDKLKIEVRNKLDKLDKLQDLEYDPDCNFCMSNPFTLDAIKTKEGIESDKESAAKLVTKLDNLEEVITDLTVIRDKKIKLDKTIDELKQIKSRQSEVKFQKKLLIEKKDNLSNKLITNKEKIDLYYEQEKDILYNKQIEESIEKVEKQSDGVKEQLDILTSSIQTCYGELKVLETKKYSILDTIEEVEKLEKKYNAYEYYLDAVKRDGVPYELISKALPMIEGEVNNILSQIVDFQIIFEMDGKNINNYLVYDDDNVWPLELSSGMERFISSLAIRVGLINVSNLPCSNFLAIDEGFGTMDSDNINSVYQLFQYLKSQFQFALIVSHIDSMRDTVDTLLEIKKENDFSEINFA